LSNFPFCLPEEDSSSMEKKFAIYQDKKIYYRATGRGTPVMLVHGFGEDDSIWNDLEKFLKGNYRLVIPQLPGTGQSELLPKTSMETMAAALLAIADQEGFGTFTLLGHSMGGYITLAFAEKYPGRLKAFGLLHSTAYADSKEKKIARRNGIGFIRENGSAAFFRTSNPNLFSEKTRKEHPELVERIVSKPLAVTAEAAIAYYEAMIRRKSRTSILKSAQVPVLFIIGKYDKAVLPAAAIKQSTLPAISYIHILENSGHLGMFEEPEKFNKAIAVFIRESN